MTPKEKAQELYDLLRYEISQNDTRLDVFGINFISKQCALITVDEILQECLQLKVEYWEQVKKEIENL